MKHIADNLKALVKRTNQTLIELIAGIIVLAVILCVAGLFLPIRGTFIAGVLFGSVYAAVMAVHMTVTIEDSLDLLPDDAAKHMKRGYGFRLILTIAVIIAGLKLPLVHFAGVFAGMMTLKVSVFIRPLICRAKAALYGKNTK